jgi:hypothetical protein
VGDLNPALERTGQDGFDGDIGVNDDHPVCYFSSRSFRATSWMASTSTGPPRRFSI